MPTLSSLEKYRIIEPILKQRATIAAVAKHHLIPLRTIWHWKNSFLKDGINALERKPRSDKAQQKLFSNDIIKLVEGFALQKPPMNISTIHKSIKIICQKEGLSIPSYHWVYQKVKAIAPSLITLAQKGSKAYKDKFEFLYRQQSTEPNYVWQADHTLLDLWAITEKEEIIRPWLTIVMDDFSRVICGYYLSITAPNATNTALALRQAIWTKKQSRWSVCGIPQKLYTDNGADFISGHIEQVCLKLKIEIIHSLPGNPRGRGKIERFFNTLNTSLLQALPGYSIGGKPSSKPTLSIKALESHIDDFIIESYNHYTSNKNKIAPIQQWDMGGTFLPQMPHSLESLDDLMLRVDKPRRVHRDGIKFMGLRYASITLVAFVGEFVVIRYDPRDLAEIKVYFTDGCYLCKAVCQDIASLTISFQELLTARKAIKKKLEDKIKQVKHHLQNATAPLNNKIEQEHTKRSFKITTTLKLYDNE